MSTGARDAFILDMRDVRYQQGEADRSGGKRLFSTSSLLLVAGAGAVCGCHSDRLIRAEPDRALIESLYSSVDLSDGVSRDEAIVIAQHHMLSGGYDYDWFVAAPRQVSDDPESNRWMIEFKPKADGWGSGPRPSSELTLPLLLPYWVWVDKENGAVSVTEFRIEP